MEAWAAALEEAGHGPPRIQGFQDLDRSGKGHSDALGCDLFGPGTCFPGEEFEQATPLLQGGYDHGDVVQRIC
jgi:hypothetical protein